MLRIPLNKPDTGRGADLTDEEWAAWRERTMLGDATSIAAGKVAAAAIRDNPALLDEFRLYAAQFPHYNIANSMRLWVQDPDATRVQGARWWSGEGREVVDGARPLYVMALHERRKRANKNPEQEPAPDSGDDQKGRSAYVGKPVFDVSQTVPKPDASCILCRSDPGQPCHAKCPVFAPNSGQIPSRFDVLVEANLQLRKVGGLDAEAILAALGPDPYRDGDRVEGSDTFKIRIPKPGGKGARLLTVHVSQDLDSGRTRYAIVKIGVFWLGLDALEYDRSTHGGQRQRNQLRVQYGDAAPGHETHRHQEGSALRRGAPVINGISLAGDGTYNADTITEDGRHGPWVGRLGRYSSISVPAKTEQTVRAIVYSLTQHWLAQPAVEQLRAAHDRFHAPGRQARHEHRAAQLREQVAELAAELAAQEDAAARQESLTGDDELGGAQA
ncbi:hypothetical protein ACIBKY_51435 [Nonomuraea sp. NPDC050394]|uniref:hypothetical protein n=1 Tax=Nonomuraea sp. NPDC050394 TaxID=3364363 RepID=UPI0037B493F8